MNYTDKEIVEYLERAEKIAQMAFHLPKERITNEVRIEIAKMIQKEEAFRKP